MFLMDILSIKQRFGIIGNNPVLNNALEVAVRVAPTDLSVLVTGESGVGKEFFPQVIHAYSTRKHNKYIAVNCGAIPEGTVDSELFGHEKGSFTGATEARKGYFEEANGGTIFLDEVSELPLSTQARLLRVLQTGEYISVGSSKTRKTDVRIVAATNINLPNAIAAGRFREDLYYRLNAVPIIVSALRERREDIFLLFRKFAADVATQYRMPAISLTDDARQELEDYAWPGNIRQLKNVAEQISAVEALRLIDAATLRKYLPAASRTNVPVVVGSGPRNHSDERELLYKVLFDMRSEMLEMKQMLSEVLRGQPVGGGKSEISGYLAPQSHYQPVAPISAQAVYADTEVIADEPQGMTKEQAQREEIMRELRRHNGRRKEAAKALYISERTLYRRIKELGIEEIDNRMG